MTLFCRLIVDEQPCCGSWNMAVDEALLMGAVELAESPEKREPICVVRVYRWSEATLSLGYFQDRADLPADSSAATLPHVRRLSGGGAIVHHHEFTYSLTLSAGHPLSAEPVDLYAMVHRQLLRWLATFGIHADLRGKVASKNSVPDVEPFLCFSRGDERDIVLDGQKIVGSAQRRRRGAILQHGSLILQGSSFAPHLVGVSDLSAVPINEFSLQDFAAVIAKGVAGSSSIVEQSLTVEERASAERLERERYQFSDWKPDLHG